MLFYFFQNIKNICLKILKCKKIKYYLFFSFLIFKYFNNNFSNNNFLINNCFCIQKIIFNLLKIKNNFKKLNIIFLFLIKKKYFFNYLIRIWIFYHKKIFNLIYLIKNFKKIIIFLKNTFNLYFLNIEIIGPFNIYDFNFLLFIFNYLIFNKNNIIILFNNNYFLIKKNFKLKYIRLILFNKITKINLINYFNLIIKNYIKNFIYNINIFYKKKKFIFLPNNIYDLIISIYYSIKLKKTTIYLKKIENNIIKINLKNTIKCFNENNNQKKIDLIIIIYNNYKYNINFLKKYFNIKIIKILCKNIFNKNIFNINNIINCEKVLMINYNIKIKKKFLFKLKKNINNKKLIKLILFLIKL